MKKLFAPFFLWYIRAFARLQLSKTNPIIIGVAGSSGKSSLARIITSVLQSTYQVNATKEKNSETGIPLHVLNIHMEKFSYLAWLKVLFVAPLRLLFFWPRYQVLVAEMGIDSPVEPKNMGYLLKIIRPTIGVVTNVSLEHSVYFEPYATQKDPKKREEEILAMTAYEETRLLTSLPKQGFAIVNLDDTAIVAKQSNIKSHLVTVSLSKKADLQTKQIISTLNDFSMSVVYQAKTYPLILSQPLPQHFAYEFLMAIAVGIAMEISVETAITAIQTEFVLPPGRLSFFKGIKETVIIDSSYNNATLPPILDILTFMKEISGKRRKVGILGDMRELGSLSKESHEIVAKKIMETLDVALLIGPEMKRYAAPILEKAKFDFLAFDTFTQAKESILARIQTEDVILVKGSQNTLFLERVVEMLLADKKDMKRLTRRGEFWDKKRSETP